MLSSQDPGAKETRTSFHPPKHSEEPNPEAAIKLAGDKLIHFQVSENYRGTPGTGITPWVGILAHESAMDGGKIIPLPDFTLK